MIITLVLGGAGCGKTFRLIQVVREALESGIPPERVAFVAFTRAAAKEARDRAGGVLGLTAKQLPHFRTIHSACFRALGLNRRQVISPADLEEIGSLVGEEVSWDSPMMTVDGKSRVTGRSVDDIFLEGDDTRSVWAARRFHKIYDRYRFDSGVVDFTDMLASYVQDGEPLDVDVAVVDEAQDLSDLQWDVVHRMFSRARYLYVGGDDVQAIHEWGGAARTRFMSMVPDHVEVLPMSIRLPEPIFDLSQMIVSRIVERLSKEVRSSGRPGKVEWIGDPFAVDLSTGTWLMLGRTRAIARILCRVAVEQGVPHSYDGEPVINKDTVTVIRDYEAWRKGSELEAEDAARVLLAMGSSITVQVDRPPLTAVDAGVDATRIWHDALVGLPLEEREHLLGYLRAGSSITKAVRVNVGTIHSAKGLEADNVLLSTDMTAKVRRGMERDPDAEHRVWYVGVTRASSNLFLCFPTRMYHYSMD